MSKDKEEKGKGEEKRKDAERKDKGKKDFEGKDRGRGKPEVKKPVKVDKDLRYIVRISGRDLNGEKSILQAVRALDGVSHRYAVAVAKIFEKETGISAKERIGKIPKEKDAVLEEIITNPEKHGVPEWLLNRRKDYTSGKSTQLIMGDLKFGLRSDVKRLNEIKSYRGLRHEWGLPVRGQRTKSTHRGKGGTIGVIKKEAKEAKA